MGNLIKFSLILIVVVQFCDSVRPSLWMHLPHTACSLFSRNSQDCRPSFGPSQPSYVLRLSRVFLRWCCSVTKSCLTPRDLMDCSIPGSPVFHYHPVYSNPCPLSRWCYPTISSSATPFSFCLQSLPASGSLSVSQLFAVRGPTDWSFSFSNSPSNEYSGLISFRIDWFDLHAVWSYVFTPFP